MDDVPAFIETLYMTSCTSMLSYHGTVENRDLGLSPGGLETRDDEEVP